MSAEQTPLDPQGTGNSYTRHLPSETSPLNTLLTPSGLLSKGMATRYLSLTTEPREVWGHFADLNEIPRPSGHENGVRDYAKRIAQMHGLEYRQDKVGNVVLAALGVGRGVNSPTVVFQAHMDMITVKDPEVEFDFHNDPIRTRLEQREISGVMQEVLTACGTTLGADNGIGASLALALLTSQEIKNAPPREVLLTVNEERSMIGAKQLDPTIVTGRLLVNLDTEELGDIYVSCAGGRDLVAEWPVTRHSPAAGTVPLKIVLEGLPSGHSGAEIHERRGNAILMMATLLGQFENLDIASLNGGTARNAIPDWCEAIVWVPHGEVEAVIANVQSQPMHALLAKDVAPIFHNFTVGAKALDTQADTAATQHPPQHPIDPQHQKLVLSALATIPSKVEAMSEKIEGLVETSNNLAIISTGDNHVKIDCMSRSSKPGAIDDFQRPLQAKLEALGAVVQTMNESPLWEMDPDNPLVALAARALEYNLGRKPQTKAIHAGLECGAIGQKISGMKMTSFGPDIRGAHTTAECTSPSSLQVVWKSLVMLTEELC